MRKITFCLPLLILFAGCQQQEWFSLFNGRDLDGWQASENKDSWIIENGAIVTSGPRSHLFYTGDVMNHEFRNFEFMAEVKTEPVSNSGIYFHTQFQEDGWPEKGYECQIINSRPDPKTGRTGENKMTGSIYAIRNVWKSPVGDREWFQYRIVVRGKTIQTFINGELISEYTEPDNPYRTESFRGRLLSSGTFALQCHDPGSRVSFRNIRVKPLPDNLPTPGTPPADPEFEKQIIELAGNNIPLVDLHVHLKGGLTMEDALGNARKYGFTYGFAVNCGKDMTLQTNKELRKYLDGYNQPPETWHGMQSEGREWTATFSAEQISRFDYVFTDAMTWTNDSGKRMRLWIPEETVVGDPQEFMGQLVERIIKIVENEPIDIYVNPTYLPDEIMGRYDELWTEKRMDRVISALAEHHVALEINNRRMIPSPAFIRRAKEAGVKFTFGTNNAGADDLDRMEYAIRMIRECGLEPGDIWLPD